MENQTQQEPVQAKKRGCGCVVLVFVVIVAIILGAQSCGTPHPAPKSASLDTAVEQAIKDSGAQKQSVELNDDVGTSAAGDKVALIHVKAPITARATILDNSCKLLKDLQGRKDVGQVTLFWTGTLVDAYGNKSDTQVVKLTVSKATLDKINFDNFVYNDLPNIADSYWEHAAMAKEKK